MWINYTAQKAGDDSVHNRLYILFILISTLQRRTLDVIILLAVIVRVIDTAAGALFLVAGLA